MCPIPPKYETGIYLSQALAIQALALDQLETVYSKGELSRQQQPLYAVYTVDWLRKAICGIPAKSANNTQTLNAIQQGEHLIDLAIYNFLMFKAKNDPC